MKSRWLKKAMAAFLAVLMTVCALPVAAFVPETVESGEENITEKTVANDETALYYVTVTNSPNWDILSASYLDSFVGQVVVDKNVQVSSDSNTWQPYVASSGFNVSGCCVNYACARLVEKCRIIRHWASGNGKDVAAYAKSHDGEALTKIHGAVSNYTVRYLGTDKNKLKGNSMASFTSKTATEGHVIFVEAVVTNSAGTKIVYYTEGTSSTSGVLRKTTLDEFVSGTFQGGIYPSYLGAVCFEGNFASAPVTPEITYSDISTSTYRLVNNGSYLTTVADDNATELTVKAKNGTSNQQFYVSPNSRFSQSYIIKSQAYSSGRVVNVFTTGVSANGDNVTLYTSTTDASQSWKFEAKNGGYLIHPVDNTGLALTNSNGTVKVMTSSGASNQIWTLASAVDTYTVSYNANGGTGAPGNQTKTHGQSLTLSSVKPTKDGYTFQGWSTTLNGSVQYNPGSAYTGNANLTLYAVWNPVKYPIYFNANGGTGAPDTQYQTHFEYLTLSSVVPKKAGYTFKGWSTALNGTVAYQPGGQFGENRSVTLYAVWAVIPVTSITLNQTTASLKKGETLTLTATVAPSDAANKSVTWSSGNTSVATVSTSGVVTAVGEGTAVITVKTADGGKTATCTVTVAHTHNYTGTYYETAHPHKAYSKCSCGEINYTGATQKVASCTSCYPVTGVTLDQTTATLKKGETLSLAVTVSPSDAANKAFTVTSSNPSVMSAKYRIGVCVGDLFDGSACTASHCEFTALSAGSTTLTFTTEDGQKTASCTVTVTEPVVNAKAKFTLSEASGRPGDTVKITLSLKTEETVNSIAISGITYDKSIMTFTEFSDYEHIEDLTILPPTFDEEKMAIVIGLKNAAAFDGDICTLNFKINENALEGVTNIDASSVVKLKSAEIPSAVASGKVNVRLQTLGDIDGNDTVDIDDAVLLFQYSMLPELYPISYAGNLDFNKDGTVDIDDAVRLFQYSMLPDLYPLE